MPVIAANTALLSDVPDHFHFARGKADIHEWELDIQTGAVWFTSEPGIFKDIKNVRAFFEAVHPEDRSAAERITETMLHKADRYRYECRLVTDQGDVNWISVNACSEGPDGRIERLYGFTQDITARKRAEAVAQGQKRALELAMTGAPLEEIFDLTCRLAEEQAGGRLLASIMLLDIDQQQLRFGAAPSLPIEYSRSLDGLTIGPNAGSCGAAAFLASPVFVCDIERDERWRQFAHLALPLELKACWSVPLLSTKGTVLGTIALYSRETTGPTEWELESIALLANSTSLIIERYREMQERSRAELRFRSLVCAANAIVWTTSKEVQVFTPQPEWAKFTGFTDEQVKGMGWLEAIHPEDRDMMLSIILRMRQEAFVLQTEVRLRRADGEFREMELNAVPILDESGSIKEWAGSYIDITARKQSEKRLHHLATHDALTGLPNRAFLNEHLQELLDFTPPTESLAVMFIDLDRFKHINDSMGHDSGDNLLRHVARRLRNTLAAGDLVARLGGDEFVIVAHAQHGRASAESLATKLVSALAAPVDVEGAPLFSSASIGICVYPEDGRRKDVLMQHADIAMYKAKADGGNRYSFFSADMGAAIQTRMALETELRGALERGELVLHYQPRIGLPDKKLRGVEALVRWESPTRGLVSPMDFIPIAEESGLIDAIGMWVTRQACADIQRLNERMGCSLCVSVNLSPKQLMSASLVQQVKNALDAANMRPEQLELELTENAFIHDVEASISAMRELKTLGVLLAVDDFGTGHAGIAYLRRFPVDIVKLDRTFTIPVASEPNGFGFMKALAEMAHMLGLHVVAEGVEDETTLGLLCKARCDEAQGYLFAKPLALPELVKYVEQYSA